MLLGDRLRALREARKLSQGDIEKRSGLKRSYISRVEGSHKIPSVETLEKRARALDIPLYHLFYEGEKPPRLLKLPWGKRPEEITWGRSKKELQVLQKLFRLLSRMRESDRRLNR